jgi:hypothetical protein
METLEKLPGIANAPGLLSTTTTANAPTACACIALYANGQVPRSTTTMLPFTASELFQTGSQPSAGTASPRNPRFPIYRSCLQTTFPARMSIFKSGISRSGYSADERRADAVGRAYLNRAFPELPATRASPAPKQCLQPQASGAFTFGVRRAAATALSECYTTTGSLYAWL